MFVTAIERASLFTRPIYFIGRFYGSTEVHPGAATLFFVNDQGWALTCKHVLANVLGADQLAARRNAFLTEKAALRGNALPKQRKGLATLEKKHGFGKGAPYEAKTMFINCVQGPLAFDYFSHSSEDVALLHFKGYATLGCTSFPVFPIATTGLKQGKSICRLGFPFPEFTNFTYDAATDSIDWRQAGQTGTPQFPIEGMLTRHLLGTGGMVVGFELSTPGLKGQRGGPAFDVDGRVWGMQSQTMHLDLDFDVDQEVIRNGEKKKVKDSAFLHVGRCVHVDVLKSFMRQHNVAFTEA